MKIETNDFTRQFIIVDDEKNIVESSNTVLNIRNIDEYLKYVNNIKKMSTVYYNITKRCNFNCTYCYSLHEDSIISLSDNEIVLRKLEELNTKSITLIGGEPFCHPNFHEILKSCIDKEYLEEICVVTNGSLIDDTKMHLYCSKKVTIQVSIDGIDENTNAPTRGKNHFEQVFENILKLKNAGANIVVMKVLTHDNVENSKEFYQFYKEKNIDVGFFMVKQVEDAEKPDMYQLKSLLDYIYEKENNDIEKVFHIVNFADNMMMDKLGFPIMHCGAGINAISIMPSGDVYPCVKKEKSGSCITNILNENAIKDIARNREKIINSELVFLKEGCSVCDIAFYCGGGCRAEESYCGEICEYNCNYFHFAKEYYLQKVLSKYEKRSME